MSQLEQYKRLTLATLDYLIEHFSNSFIVDGHSQIRDHYEREKLMVEKHFAAKSETRLKQQFERLVGPLRLQGDMVFASYILEKTNYSIDIFSEIKSRVSLIVIQKKINTSQEAEDVAAVLNIYKKTKTDPNYEKTLIELLGSYYSLNIKPESNNRTTAAGKNQSFQEIISPDGKKRINIAWLQYGENSTTTVSIIFEQASGSIYGKMSIDHDLKVTWKNNDTIVITSKKDNALEAPKHRKIQSFDDVITIEYVEI